MGRKPLWKHFDYSYNLQSTLRVLMAPKDSKKSPYSDVWQVTQLWRRKKAGSPKEVTRKWGSTTYQVFVCSNPQDWTSVSNKYLLSPTLFTVTAVQRGDKYGRLHNSLSKLKRSPSPRLIHPRFHWDGQGMLGADFLLSWKLCVVEGSAPTALCDRENSGYRTARQQSGCQGHK